MTPRSDQCLKRHLVAGNPDYQEGVAYIYRRNLSVPQHWEKVTMLLDPEGKISSDNFGNSVTIDGDIVVVANSSTYVNYNDQGAVVIFNRNAGGADSWGVTDRLTDTNGLTGDFFGANVSLSGDTLAIGSSGDDDFGSSAGAIHVYGKYNYELVFLPLIIR